MPMALFFGWLSLLYRGAYLLSTIASSKQGPVQILLIGHFILSLGTSIRTLGLLAGLPKTLLPSPVRSDLDVC
jgi:hypothetical protein